MNKGIILLGALVSFNVNAASWYIPNEAGGQIVISDGECWFKGKQVQALNGGFTRIPSGVTLKACWYYKDGIVHILFETGDERTYPVDNFKRME